MRFESEFLILLFMSKQTFFVRGTSCKSCEVVIERKLIKDEDVLAVDVSHGRQSIYLETKGEREYSEGELNELLKPHGYSVGKKEKRRVREAIDWRRVGAAFVLAASVYIILNATGLLRLSPSTAAPSGLVGVLIVGLIASVSSCTAVVGGLVAAVSGAISKGQDNLSPAQKLRPHILFNVGRVGGFFVLGAVIGLLGSALQLNTTLNGVFMIAVAALMIVIGVNLMDVLPAGTIAMPKWLSHKVHDLAESKNPLAPIVLGAATFFLPCGFTQSMQLLALSTQDPLMSGGIMAVFALGTVPVLLGIGGATSYASGATLKRVVQGAGVLVLVLGFSNVLNGATLLGFNPDAVFAKNNSAPVR